MLRLDKCPSTQVRVVSLCKVSEIIDNSQTVILTDVKLMCPSKAKAIKHCVLDTSNESLSIYKAHCLSLVWEWS